REAKAIGHFHQAYSLSISLRTRHAKIVLDPAFGVGPFFMADDADTFAAEASKASNNGGVLAELPVTGERDEAGDEPVDVVGAMRALRMAGDLRFLPGRELGVQVLQGERGFCLKPANLFADGDGIAALAHRAEFLDFGLQLGHRFFEIEIAAHWVRASVFWAN